VVHFIILCLQPMNFSLKKTVKRYQIYKKNGLIPVEK